MKKNTDPEKRLGFMLQNRAYLWVMKGGKYEEEFAAMLENFRGTPFDLAITAFTLGAACQKRENVTGKRTGYQKKTRKGETCNA